MRIRTGRIVLTLSACAASAVAQEERLTLQGALERVRDHSPVVLSARIRVEEARARLSGARVLRDNPLVEGAVGRRSATQVPPDLDFRISQTFELGGQRGARVAGAEAAIARETAASEDVLRAARREVAVAFLRGLAADERSGLARAVQAHAEELVRIAERRYAAGDVAALDLNLAASILARARSEVHASAADGILVVGELRGLLGLDPAGSLALDGELAPRTDLQLPALLEAVGARPDLRALQAELHEAEAEARGGRASRWPAATPSVRFERDEGNHVLWGGVTLTLPLWNHGQEVLGLGEARASRARLQSEAGLRTALIEVRAAFDAWRLRLSALRELETTASRLAENETLARRSYEVGQIGLAEVLLVQRETVEARVALLERRLRACETEIDLLSRAGVLR